MDAQLKQKWVEALRSGEYRQTRLTFEDENGFCCLGVLCKVAHKKTVNGGISNWTAIHDMGVVGLRRLWEMNDKEGKSFSEIADYIEANIPADEATAA